MQLKVARKLDRILTISEASTDDIAREFNLDRQRMRNVGNVDIPQKAFLSVLGDRDQK